jgi:DNA-binding XRE family transcriptional regulator
MSLSTAVNGSAFAEGVAATMREKREAAGLSQVDLGRLAGVHSTHINKIENHKGLPSEWAARRIAAALARPKAQAAAPAPAPAPQKPDAELAAIQALLAMSPEARARVLGYVQGRG